MAISYIVSMEELKVLAAMANADSFEWLPELPAIDQKRYDELLGILDTNGMVKVSKNKGAAYVDMAVCFIISTMANPELVIRTAAGAVGYCTKQLGVVVCPDKRAKDKFRITPLPDARAMAEKLWEYLAGEEPGYTEADLLKKISEVYVINQSLEAGA